MVKRLLLLVMLMSGCMVANAQADSDKDFISQTSKDLVNQWDTEAFQNVLNLLNQLFSYNTEEISVWGSNAIKATKTAITTPYKGITEGKMLMIRPSTFTGHFNVVNNRWVYQGAADDLQFSFKDQEGNSCLALITSSGNTQTITLTYEYDEKKFEEDDDDDDGGLLDFQFKGLKDVMKDIRLISIELPEHFEISFTQGNKQLMLTKVDFELSNSTEWDALKDGFMVSVNSSYAKSTATRAGTGTFEVGMNRVGYKPGEGINFGFYAKNDGNPVISFGLNMPGTLNLDDGIFGYEKEKGLVFKNIGLQSLNLDIDIMGRIQARGNIPDLYKFVSALTDTSGKEDEAAAKQALSELSSMMSGGIYYNNGTDSQGSFGLNLVYNEEEEEWTMQPTISFTSDNTAMPLQEFFTKENFSDFVDGMATITGSIMEVAAAVKNSVSRMDSEATDIDKLPIIDVIEPGAEVFTVGGQSVTPSATLPRGTYIIKTTAGTYKFIKK